MNRNVLKPFSVQDGAVSATNTGVGVPAVENIPVPDPTRHDIEEVQCALAVAAARWEHGDFDDALRWLRRAARAAADNEQLERALELSKAAATLSRQRSEPPPPPRKSQTTPRVEHRPIHAPRPAFTTRQERPHLRAVPRARPAPPPRRTPAPPRVPNVRQLPSVVRGDDEDEPTMLRFVPNHRPPHQTEPNQDATRPDLPAIPAAPAPLSASRVAVMRDPTTGRPTLMVLPPHVAAPPGSAVAMLVASSSDDTLRLGELLEHFVLNPT